jgi:hypothetical protein
MLLCSLFRGLILRIESKKSTSYHSVKSANICVTFSTAYRKFLIAVFAFLRVFLDLNKPVIFLEQMEKIGDREAAIADRVKALLEAANSTAAAVAGTVASSGSVVRSASAPVTRSSRRLDPSLDPATVVANLTAAGIQLAVS